MYLPTMCCSCGVAGLARYVEYAAVAQHGNEAHAPDFAEATHVHSWDTIYGKPTEYPASNHGNERHNPDFVTTSEYSVHRHGVTVPAGGTWYDTTAPV